ncbi:MAG TPA: beta-galactosidase [Verrucomicrobiae bacterium]|nr:beta-galactosidase [Verrucomicrobiae bacterium]
MKISNFFPFLVALSAPSLVAQMPATEEMFPFVIPELAAPPAGSAVDVAWLNDRPAGGHGFVRARGGHFVDGTGKRVRFLASNFTFGSCFPDHDTADHLATRLASLGINCIRFHHIDNQEAPRGIWKAGTPKKNELDPDQLDRLDYFISALKRHGIYADINLHISRNYWEGEDFPDGLASNRERQEKLPNYGKAIDKLNDQMIRMQRDYARALLMHVNAYTHASYAKEPCVAIVEINNENSLLQLKLASLPEYYRADVLKKWNHWLKAHYGSTEKLAVAWGGVEELGTNVLPALPTTQGSEYFAITNGIVGETQIHSLKTPEVSWHAQLQWRGLSLEEGRTYTLEFSARSDLPRQLALSTRLDKPDWHNCGLTEEAQLGPEWKSFTYPFRAKNVEAGAVRFDIVVGGGPMGDFSIKNPTLRRGGSLGLKPAESLEAGTVEAPARTQGTPRGLAWTRFLAEIERAYTDGMRMFLKKDLGVEASIIDTQASYGGIAGAYRESFNDFVDMHAYWQHPSFPGRPWDAANWNIRNTPMVADQSGGNLARLAIYRVAGKPFTVSEYDHPAPSHYAAEMFPMLASFAAVQDWDGLFQFDWGGPDADTHQITGYFSLQQHPAKLAFLPAAALMFRRGDVDVVRNTARLMIPVAQVEELTAENISMADAWKKAGVSTSDLLEHRLELGFMSGGKLEAGLGTEAKSPVSWDTKAGSYTVDAPAAKAVVGHCAGKTTVLEGAKFEVKANSRNFACLTLNALDGQPVARSSRLLLVAAGDVENTGMGWNADHTSVGTQWGRAPTICEGIAAIVTLTTTAKAARVHALDGNGARAGEVPAKLAAGKLSFTIGPQFKTLWYEIVVE